MLRFEEYQRITPRWHSRSISATKSGVSNLHALIPLPSTSENIDKCSTQIFVSKYPDGIHESDSNWVK